MGKSETETNNRKGELEGNKQCKERKKTSKTISSVFRQIKRKECDVTVPIGNEYARETTDVPLRHDMRYHVL